MLRTFLKHFVWKALGLRNLAWLSHAVCKQHNNSSIAQASSMVPKTGQRSNFFYPNSAIAAPRCLFSSDRILRFSQNKSSKRRRIWKRKGLQEQSWRNEWRNWSQNMWPRRTRTRWPKKLTNPLRWLMGSCFQSAQFLRLSHATWADEAAWSSLDRAVKHVVLTKRH